MALVVDLSAANRVVPDDEFRQWASEHSVFLSSVMAELKDERRLIADALADAGFTVRSFESSFGPAGAFLSAAAPLSAAAFLAPRVTVSNGGLGTTSRLGSSLTRAST